MPPKRPNPEDMENPTAMEHRQAKRPVLAPYVLRRHSELAQEAESLEQAYIDLELERNAFMDEKARHNNEYQEAITKVQEKEQLLNKMLAAVENDRAEMEKAMTIKEAKLKAERKAHDKKVVEKVRQIAKKLKDDREMAEQKITKQLADLENKRLENDIMVAEKIGGLMAVFDDYQIEFKRINEQTLADSLERQRLNNENIHAQVLGLKLAELENRNTQQETINTQILANKIADLERQYNERITENTHALNQKLADLKTRQKHQNLVNSLLLGEKLAEIESQRTKIDQASKIISFEKRRQEKIFDRVEEEFFLTEE